MALRAKVHTTRVSRGSRHYRDQGFQRVLILQDFLSKKSPSPALLPLSLVRHLGKGLWHRSRALHQVASRRGLDHHVHHRHIRQTTGPGRHYTGLLQTILLGHRRGYNSPILLVKVDMTMVGGNLQHHNPRNRRRHSGNDSSALSQTCCPGVM